MTDRELFNLAPDYEQTTGLDQVTFEVPYDLMKVLLKGYGYRLSSQDFLSIKIHPTTKTKKTVGQCQFLFSIWMNDHLKPAPKPSVVELEQPVQKLAQTKHLDKSGRRFRHHK